MGSKDELFEVEEAGWQAKCGACSRGIVGRWKDCKQEDGERIGRRLLGASRKVA